MRSDRAPVPQPVRAEPVEARVPEHGLRHARGERNGSQRGGCQRGFTLIEVMVALAVFGLAALALIRLESATIRGAGTLDGTILAQMVAQSVAVDAVTGAQPPVIGPTRGAMVDGGRNWVWTRVVSPVGGGILRIDVAVADARGQVLGRLTMVRAPQATPS